LLLSHPLSMPGIAMEGMERGMGGEVLLLSFP
jgi:hypothetical protein